MRFKLFCRAFFALLIPLYFSCNSSSSSSSKSSDTTVVLPFHEEAIPVKTSQVSFGDFSLELLCNGKSEASGKAEIVFNNIGVVRSVFVKNGDRVSRGQILAVLDQAELRQKLSRAADQLNKSVIDLKDRLIDYGFDYRDSAKVPKDIMTVAKSKSGYNTSVFDYQEAKYRLGEASLKAPFSGKIANLESYIGGTAGTATKFCTLIDDQMMKVTFDLLEAEYSFVQPSSSVIVNTLNGAMSWSGKVISINPLVDKNGMIRVTALITNSGSQALLDGMNVRVTIRRFIGKQIYVPKEAVIERQNRFVVFAVEHGRAKWHYVTTGEENSQFITVKEGLKSGQQIVVSNVANLANNSLVSIGGEGDADQK
jgi:RND family efflux transporter MFP subunit